MIRIATARKVCLWFGVVCLFALLAGAAKKKKDDETQTLQLPKELPAAVEAQTRRLSFYVTPLSTKGLLSRQVHDALKSLERQAAGQTVVHIRAFVAGSGDLRRVKDLVSEEFTDRKQPLPALSVIRAGGLPAAGAQVVLEGTAEAKKDLYPAGVAFFSAVPAFSDDPLAPAAPLAETSLDTLQQSMAAAAVMPDQVLQITCFLSSLEGLNGVRARVASAYPKAAANFVQTQRAPVRALGACEAVAAGASAGEGPIRLLHAQEAAGAAGESRAALLSAPRVVLTGTQSSFGFEEQDVRLAFTRLQKELEQHGASLRDVAFARLYPLSPKIQGQAERVRQDFFDASQSPAGTLLQFEGLAAIDAGFAVEVIAVKP